MAPTGAILALIKAAASGVSAYKSSLDDDTAGVAASTAAAVQGLLTGIIKEVPSTAAQAMLKVTEPLEWAIAILAALECINGFGNPDKGAALKDMSVSYFDTATQDLKGALGYEEMWSGDAATAYRELVKKLQLAVEELKAADKDLAGQIALEAETILLLRQKYSYTKAVLVGLIPVTWGVYLAALASYSAAFQVPPLTPDILAKAFTIKFQFGFILLALGELATFTGIHMNQHVPAIASTIQTTVAHRYDEAKRLAKLASPNAQAQTIRSSAAPKVSAFQTTRGSSGNFPSGSSRPYPVAGSGSYPVAGARSYPVAGVAGGRGDAATESDDAEAPPTPAPPAPEPAAPVLPSITITQAAMNAAKALAQTAGQVIQSTVQQATSAGQQAGSHGSGGAAGRPAPGVPAEDAGTAADAEAGERAPIDATAGGPGKASPAEGRHAGTPARHTS